MEDGKCFSIKELQQNHNNNIIKQMGALVEQELQKRLHFFTKEYLHKIL